MKKYSLYLLLIIFLAIFIRFYQLGVIPGSLNHDETALGYNAYALMKTGADEHGAFLPLSLKSFGDWKLPIYPLISIPFIFLFDLTEFSVRLPSALAGVLGVFLIILICNKLFKHKEVGLLAGLFYALSPWNVYFSRMAYESNLALTFFLGGLYFFFTSLENVKKQKGLMISAILWGMTIFTYHSYVLFMPIFVFCLVILYRKNVKVNKMTIFSLGIFSFMVIISLFSTMQTSSSKLSQLSVFNDKNVEFHRINNLRGDLSTEPAIVKKVLYNKYTGIPYQITQNYLQSFSPAFLFDKGGEKLLHTLGDFGYFYLIDALFVIVGGFFLIFYREKILSVLILWLIIAPIPSSITNDAPSATRLHIFLPALLIISAYGAFCIFSFLKRSKFGILGCILLGIIYSVNVAYFIDIYFSHIDVQRGEYLRYGYKEIVKLTDKYPDYNVVMYGPENFPYITFLFYEKYDPITFRKEVQYYPEKPGFQYVKSFGRYHFVDYLDYPHLQPKTLYIDNRGIRDEDFKIMYKNGQPAFKYFFKNEN